MSSAAVRLCIVDQSRYTAELSVGHLCQKASDTMEAVTWYRVALVTCVEANEPFSGATAVKALLALTPELSSSDRELARTVAAKSWQILNLPKQPNLDDLVATTDILSRRASNPNR